MFSDYITLLLKQNGGIFSIIIMEALFTDYKKGWLVSMLWSGCVLRAHPSRQLEQHEDSTKSNMWIWRTSRCFENVNRFSTFEKCKWRKTKQAWDTLVSPIPFYKGKTSPTTVILIHYCTAAANLFSLSRTGELITIFTVWRCKDDTSGFDFTALKRRRAVFHLNLSGLKMEISQIDCFTEVKAFKTSPPK